MVVDHNPLGVISVDVDLLQWQALSIFCLCAENKTAEL
jgi:hypothetical protein